MTKEINAHAAASVATDATANATPAGATPHCCGDSTACAWAGSDPVSEAARRVEIEAARDELEAAAMDYVCDRRAMVFSKLLRIHHATERLVELRKGTT